MLWQMTVASYGTLPTINCSPILIHITHRIYHGNSAPEMNFALLSTLQRKQQLLESLLLSYKNRGIVACLAGKMHQVRNESNPRSHHYFLMWVDALLIKLVGQWHFYTIIYYWQLYSCTVMSGLSKIMLAGDNPQLLVKTTTISLPTHSYLWDNGVPGPLP